MKIVCTYQNNIATNGFIGTLASVYGSDFTTWQANQKPIFDVFDEVKPDICIIHQQLMNDFTREVLKEYNKTKVIVITNEASEFTKLQPREDLANLAHFAKGEVKDCFKTDVLYWSRNENVTDELLQVLDLIHQFYYLKIFGPVRIDMPQYLGVLDIRDTAHALASATVNLDFNNNSRFDAAVNNTLSVFYNHEEKPFDLANVNTLGHLNNNINLLLSEQQLYKKELTRIRKLVKEKHTFHHELAKTFKQTGLPDESDRILKDLEKRW